MSQAAQAAVPPTAVIVLKRDAEAARKLLISRGWHDSSRRPGVNVRYL